MLSYAGYCLWDIKMINDGAFLENDLLQFKPSSFNDKKSLEELLKINKDVVGWINIKDTNIDYPFVIGKDNLEYVNKDIYGEFSFSGTIFLDSHNNRDLSDSYNLLYGHNMANGAMFGNLNKFSDGEYFNSHLYVELYSFYQSYTIDIFASVILNGGDSRIFYPSNFEEKEMEDILNYIKEKSICYRDVGITKKDKIIALSTCSDTKSSDMMVVFGRLNNKNNSQ